MDTLFFWISKLVWLIISPGSLLVLMVLACWVLNVFNRETAARQVLSLTALVTLAIACLPLGSWLLYPLEQRFPASPVQGTDPDGIVLLGGSFSLRVSQNRQQPHLTGSGERLLAFLQLAERYPGAQLVFTGGSGSPTFQIVREADLARELFSGLGIDSSRVVFERDSRNTYENALNTRRMITPRDGETWLLVTSALHMPRAMGSFCRQGWKMEPFPVDFQTLENRHFYFSLDFDNNLGEVEIAMREWVGLLAYRLTGKTNRLIPAPTDTCPQLSGVD